MFYVKVYGVQNADACCGTNIANFTYKHAKAASSVFIIITTNDNLIAKRQLSRILVNKIIF